jgi:hypothetical protein
MHAPDFAALNPGYALFASSSALERLIPDIALLIRATYRVSPNHPQQYFREMALCMNRRALTAEQGVKVIFSAVEERLICKALIA